jgi:Reverse transcriptase (RNA-dependent DNA polymerase)
LDTLSKKKKIFVKYKKERVILSDVLPFEIPVTFSNRQLYHFLLSCRITLEEDKLIIKKNNTVANQEIVKLLFGISHDRTFDPLGAISFKEKITIPFSYKIVHKENDFRELSVIHPKNQVLVTDFYNRYRELILYYNNISPFTIRKPHRIAKYTYFIDSLHLERLADINDEIVEEYDKEYENLKTFFVYKKYSNIYKFYESYQYHQAEKKYNYLIKFDLSKCFDSIYTHSITWALFNKEVVKKHIKKINFTFGDKFDTLMKNLNYEETNGIVIGPEFSRIFAEIILQRIDSNIKNDLDKENVYYKKDYEIFRYVDDYFIFYNNELKGELIITLMKLKLKEYKLYFNDSKKVLYSKPIITEITIAKQKIAELLDKSISYDIEEIPGKVSGENDRSLPKGKIFIDSNMLIRKFKTILYEFKVDYKDILNYTFSIIERKLRILIKKYFKIIHEEKTEKEFIKAILELLDFVFFIYTVSPRVNTTIKLSRILRIILDTLKLRNKFNYDLKHLVFKKIYDNIYFTLNKNKSIEHTQVETLYLLTILNELGKEYWLTEVVLADYLCIKERDGKYQTIAEINYFTIVVSLFYMKDKVRFKKLRSFILEKVVEKFEIENYSFRIKKSELILLLFDILAYDYVDILPIKRKILKLYKIQDRNIQDQIISAQRNWFTKWSDFTFGKELDFKLSQEVY